MTDVRKAVAASDTSPASRHKPAASASSRRAAATPQKLGKSPRDREREWEDERWWEEERESFPQYCMTCEKQFVPQDERFLYCSEACRAHDQDNNAPAVSMASKTTASHHGGNYPFYASGNPEPRDIIPRASPSRPSSLHLSSPPPSAALPTSAMSALRSLSIRDGPPSPPGTYHGSSIWPFARSPSTSYTRSAFPSTYDTAGYYYSAGAAAGYASEQQPPTPTSRRPGNHHARLKSVELVTPMVGR